LILQSSDMLSPKMFMNKGGNVKIGKIILMLAIFAVLVSCSKEVDYKHLQLRNDLVYMPNENQPFTGSSTEYYKQGQVKNKRSYKNGKDNGESIYYFQNGNIWTITRYRGGKLNGESINYYENGQVERKINYKDDVFDGISIYYYENGQIMKELNFKAGQLQN